MKGIIYGTNHRQKLKALSMEHVTDRNERHLPIEQLTDRHKRHYLWNKSQTDMKDTIYGTSHKQKWKALFMEKEAAVYQTDSDRRPLKWSLFGGRHPIKHILLKDNYGFSDGDIKSRSFIGVGTGHPHVSVRHGAVTNDLRRSRFFKLWLLLPWVMLLFFVQSANLNRLQP